MKNLFVSAAILCFSAVTMAQSTLDVSLNMEGKFLNRKAGVARGISDVKTCKTRSGIIHKGKCIITKSQNSVIIKRLDSSSYIVKISQKMAEKKIQNRDLIAVERNAVQLISTEGSCDIIIGFQNKQQISIFTEGNCSGEDAGLKIDAAYRLAAVAKKK